MREILFRGKRVDNDEWAQGSLIITKTGACYILVPSEELDISPTSQMVSFLVCHSSVGQYTGMADENKKKIFEGDVVKQGDEIGEVYYERNYCTFAIILKRNMDLFKHIKYNCEIIGNIHDNPELLR